MENNAKVSHLLSLSAIRERASQVLELAQQDKLVDLVLHEDRLNAAGEIITAVILKDYAIDDLNSIPPHGRWQHFNVGGNDRIGDLLQSWSGEVGVDEKERCRRLIDLFTVSVLLDAGAGDEWRYLEPNTGVQVSRSEGLAIASLHMFCEGAFSSDPLKPFQCDSAGLQRLRDRDLEQGMQSGSSNRLAGLSGRATLLRAFGESLQSNAHIYGKEGRMGALVDYILQKSVEHVCDVQNLWDALQQTLIPAWPKDRASLYGHSLGDTWVAAALKERASQENQQSIEYNSLQPFHKLTQWLTYSLTIPFERLVRTEWSSMSLLTGLPEYRNGGFFVDTGVITLRPATLERGIKASASKLPVLHPSDNAIVEWRALTVMLLDAMLPIVNKMLREMGAKVDLSLAQLLEAGTWKAGRLLALENRPETSCSPILIESDGTIF